MSYTLLKEKCFYRKLNGRMAMGENTYLAGRSAHLPEALLLLGFDHDSLDYVRYSREDLERAIELAAKVLREKQQDLDEITKALQFFDSAEQLLEAQELGDSINEGKPSSKGGRL